VGALVLGVGVPTAFGDAAASVRSAAVEHGAGAVPAGCDRAQPAGYARCFLSAQPVSPGAAPAPQTTTTTCAVDEAAGYTPCNIQSAYNLGTAAAAGGSLVAIVDPYDDPNAAADLATYRSNFGLPACTTTTKCFRKVNQLGQAKNYPAANADFAGETALDIEMVSAACPLCTLLLVEANSNGFGDLFTAIAQAQKMGARVISDSWGTGEFSGEASMDPTLDAPGVAITFSSGDGAYVGGVQYPSSSNYVTSVGGTELTPDSSVARGWDEATWVNTSSNPPTQGSGSGCSASEGKPAWQKDTGCHLRTTADVSMVAADVLGYDSYQASGWYYEFGTSVSSPLIAGVYGLAKVPVNLTVPASSAYAAPAKNFFKITTGSTGTCTPTYLCTAGPGYNGPTGLGTPDGIGAFKVAKSATPTVTSLALTGPTSAPTITITGTNFLTQPPPGSPEWDCGGAYTGDVFGGVGLNLSDTTDGWGAGSGGDCLGLSITSWSPTQVVLTFGSFYPGVTAMQVGDGYSFEFQGHTFTGTVAG
jgi:subtilase family serine protease